MFGLRPLAATFIGRGAVLGARHLNVHEYLSMRLLADYKIPVPRGAVASNGREIVAACDQIGKSRGYVVKAQVLAGGRGKGHFDNGFQGGVHLVGSATDAVTIGEKMLGHKLITKQTGQEGRECSKVFVVEQLHLKREFYFAVLYDRKSQGPVVVASSQGGMDIEKVAHDRPHAIITESISLKEGLTHEQAARIAAKIGFKGPQQTEAVAIFSNLYKLFLEKDATMVEINPLAETADGRVLCMDAKVNFDDNAEFRQADIMALRDTTQEDAREVQASKYNLNYIGLEGTIACLVNGAGLAMATMDLIKLNGAEPANFLDVGGGATAKQVTEAFKIINSDPRVKAIFVNIFGGIMRCDTIAQGIITAVGEIDLKLPLVVRLQGTRVEEAKALIRSSGLKISPVDDLDEAARLVVKLSKVQGHRH